MSSLLHCMVPQLVARTRASAIRGRTMATLSSSSSSSSASTTKASSAIKSTTGKCSGTTSKSTSTSGSNSTPPPAEENPLWILYKEHKGNPWAIGTVIVAAICGDAAVSYAFFGRKKEEGEATAQENLTPAIVAPVTTA
ncbi:hypothetical protein FBU30_007643 [Linnemannia zychae]|nr:hypothetical protein FBU30_007643 [Linnemannia zychae]